MGIVASLLSHKPIRVTLPVPTLGWVDIVLVSDPTHMQTINTSPAVDRLHAVPTKDVPKWAQTYFASTRFYGDVIDEWFIPFESAGAPAAHSAARRATIVEELEKGYTREDVLKILELLKSGANDRAIGGYTCPMICSRFIGGKSIPPEVIDAAFKSVTNIGEALNPMKYKAGKEGAHVMADFAAKSMGDIPKEKLQTQDVVHNIGVTSTKVAQAILLLQENPTTPVEELFTIPKNCPTPQVPRIAVAATTFDGLLARPTVPGKTVFLLNVGKAAGATKSLFYTFGSGTPERACPFKPFFESFMGDLQKELVASKETPAAASKKEE